MIVHARASWQDPNVPVAGPAIDWSRIDTVVIHYTADDDLPDGDPRDGAVAPYLRAMQRSYVTTRGYSVGYHVAVDWQGDVWELRGWDLKCAANKDHNDHTWAILVLVDGQDPATADAASAIRWCVADASARAGRRLSIVGHRDLAATACPGAGLRAQIASGAFDPEQPPAPGGDEEDDMRVIRHGRHRAAYTTNGMTKAWLADGNASKVALARCGQANPDEVDETTCVSYGPIVGPVPAGHDVYGRVIG